MGKIIKHPAFRKRPGGARKLGHHEKAALALRGIGGCGYPNCSAMADRVIGRNATLLCEEHYQRLRNAR